MNGRGDIHTRRTLIEFLTLTGPPFSLLPAPFSRLPPPSSLLHFSYSAESCMPRIRHLVSALSCVPMAPHLTPLTSISQHCFPGFPQPPPPSALFSPLPLLFELAWYSRFEPTNNIIVLCPTNLRSLIKSRDSDLKTIHNNEYEVSVKLFSL